MIGLASVVALQRRFLVEEALSELRHDARNHLAAIRNASFYLKRRTQTGAPALWSEDARVPHFFALVESEVRATEEGLGSRLPKTSETIADRGHDVVALVERLLAALVAPPSVRLVHPEPAPILAAADPAELEVALLCLIENAFEAVAERGGLVAVRCVRHDGAALLEVIDDGPGLLPGLTPARVFEPLFTTKPDRLGLGLKIARRIAARARGTLELAGGARGVRVTLSIPAVEPSRA